MSASSSRKASKSDFESFAPPQMNGTLPSSSYSKSFLFSNLISNLENPFDFSRMKRELPNMPPAPYTNSLPNNFVPLDNRYLMTNGQMNGPSTSFQDANLHMDENELEEWKPPVSLFELSNSISQESRIFEAGLILKRTMQLRSPGLIKERHVQRSVSLHVYLINVDTNLEQNRSFSKCNVRLGNDRLAQRTCN
jgi:hypothetical protein